MLDNFELFSRVTLLCHQSRAEAHILTHWVNLTFEPKSGFKNKCRVGLRLVILRSGFSRGIESIENVVNCGIGFKDLEKKLNLAKMYINLIIEKVWKSQIQPFVYSSFVLYC